ncbi:MAG TPA: hypothetical protein VE136_02610 [Anaerolineales bacterium]|nr:hypothetical protein [Anaerolineales bacterium]
MAIRNLDDWYPETLRLTVFPIIGTQIDPQETFKQIAGIPVDELKSDREIGQTTILGRNDNLVLQLVVQPDRIHWAMTSMKDRPSTDPRESSLGNFPEAITKFQPLVQEWLKSELCPELIRIAFGVILLSPVENEIDGFSRLSEYIQSLDIDPHNVSDLMYQINRWRVSKTGNPGIKLNRLNKWSVSVHQVVGFQLGGVRLNPLLGERNFAIKLELDINTDQSNENSISKDRYRPILNELIELAVEIVEEGDVQ